MKYYIPAILFALLFNTSCGSGTPANTTPVHREITAGASIQGRWMVNNIIYQGSQSLPVSPEQMKASVIKDSMMFTFSANDSVTTVAKSLQATTSSYTVTGTTLYISDASQGMAAKKTFDIIKLTPDALNMSIQQGSSVMTFELQKMQ